MSDASKKKTKEILGRLKNASFPPAAVAGALVSFADSARGGQKKASPQGAPNLPLVQIGQVPSGSVKASGQIRLAREYSSTSSLKTGVEKSLLGISIGLGDRIYVLGDGEIRVFEAGGQIVSRWKAPNACSCVAAGRDGRVYLGRPGRVEILDGAGMHAGGFDVGSPDKRAVITAIKILPKEILVADALARYIHRFDHTGKKLGEIGTRTKTGGFMLPNRFLDMDVDSKGTVIATDSGRHRVSSWAIDGTPIRYFGKFGFSQPEDFVGCCNPVNVAFAPDGEIVTAEKVIPRIKVFSTEGKLLALIGPEHFDPLCTQLHLAIDSRGRILAADPVRREIKVFSMTGKAGGSEKV